jgi:hypothetical protein
VFEGLLDLIHNFHNMKVGIVILCLSYCGKFETQLCKIGNFLVSFVAMI